jgi:hypothetical protein
VNLSSSTPKVSNRVIEIEQSQSSSKKRKRTEKTNDRSASSFNAANRGGDNVFESNQTQQKTDKVRYPSIAFDASQTEFSESHRDALLETVQRICESEIDGLTRYFSTRLPGSSHNKILLHLCEVLKQLPQEFSDNCAVDATFYPEYSRTIQNEFEKKKRKIHVLDNQIYALSNFSASMATRYDEFQRMEVESSTPASRKSNRPSSASKVDKSNFASV